MEKYQVIVVGGGVAGLTAAAYLSKYGKKVLLLEKNEKAGGLVNSFSKNGFVFDGGIRAFENSGILFPMLKELEIDMKTIHNPVQIGIEDKKVLLEDKESIIEYQKMLEEIFPESKKDINLIIQEIKKIMEYMDVLYGIDNPLFVDYKNDKKYLFNILLPWLIKYKKNIKKVKKLNEPVKDYLKKTTGDQALIDMITQHFFTGTPTFFALSYFSLYLDYSYPVGGTGVLVDRLVDYVLKSGGEIKYSSEVYKVNTYTKTIKVANNKEYVYDKMIWAGNMKSLYSSIEYHSQAKIARQEEKVKNHKGGESILSIFISSNIDKEFFRNTCGSHMFYTPKVKGLSFLGLNSWEKISKKEELMEWVQAYLRYTTFEISCPALRDENMAPQGKTGIIVSSLLSFDLVQHIFDMGWYDEFKLLCQEETIKILDEHLFGFLKESVEDVFTSTPLTLEKMTGNYHGAITGWAFCGGEVPSEHRFAKIRNSVNTPIKDIYQAGQWTFSPSGLPISILTGKLAAEAVTK